VSIPSVRLYLDPILHKPTELIKDFTGVDKITEQMLSTMFEFRGIGLAAPQIGLSLNLAILHLENKSKILVVANVTNVCYNKEYTEVLEGCLSAPGVSIKMKRPTQVEFEYSKLNGDRDKMKLEGFDARIFFHEWSHLQGQMITDSLIKL
jgi:peptide deformylase